MVLYGGMLYEVVVLNFKKFLNITWFNLLNFCNAVSMYVGRPSILHCNF